MKDNHLRDSNPQGRRPDTGAAAGNRLNVAEAVRQGTAALQQGGRAAGEAMHRIGETAKETVQQSTQALTESQHQIATTTVRTFQDAGRKVVQAAQDTSEEVRRLATLPHAAEGGLRDMQQGMTGLFAGIVQANLRATQELFRLTSPMAVIELQQRFVRECMDTSMRGTATLLQAVRRTADEILDPLEAQIEQRQAARQDHRAAA